MSGVVRHHQRAMRRGQDPFVENAESIAQIGLKKRLKIERHLERHREVLRRNNHHHWHARHRTKIALCQIHCQQPVQYLILGSYRWGASANRDMKLDQ